MPPIDFDKWLALIRPLQTDLDRLVKLQKQREADWLADPERWRQRPMPYKPGYFPTTAEAVRPKKLSWSSYAKWCRLESKKPSYLEWIELTAKGEFQCE